MCCHSHCHPCCHEHCWHLIDQYPYTTWTVSSDSSQQNPNVSVNVYSTTNNNNVWVDSSTATYSLRYRCCRCGTESSNPFNLGHGPFAPSPQYPITF